MIGSDGLFIRRHAGSPAAFEAAAYPPPAINRVPTIKERFDMTTTAPGTLRLHSPTPSAPERRGDRRPRDNAATASRVPSMPWPSSALRSGRSRERRCCDGAAHQRSALGASMGETGGLCAGDRRGSSDVANVHGRVPKRRGRQSELDRSEPIRHGPYAPLAPRSPNTRPAWATRVVVSGVDRGPFGDDARVRDRRRPPLRQDSCPLPSGSLIALAGGGHRIEHGPRA